MNISSGDCLNEILYSPSQWCENSDSKTVINNHETFTSRVSQKVKKEFPFVANVRYGTRPRQLVDIFEPQAKNDQVVPTFLYLHGGYWQALHKDSSAYCVSPLVTAGIRVVIGDYDLTPEVSLSIIVREIEELIEYLQHESETKKWGPLWIGGHSAGAHLSACMLNSQLSTHIAGVILISGVYDLQPLVKTSVNDTLKLDLIEAKKLSPMFQISKLWNKNFFGFVIIAVGENDPPSFHKQQNIFSEKLKEIGLKVDSKIILNVNHFSIVEQLSDDYYSLTKLIKNVILTNS